MSISARVTRRPILFASLVTIALVVLLGIAGTAFYLTDVTAVSPVVVVFVPVCVAMFAVLARRGRFALFGFRRPGRGWLLAAIPAVVVLALVAISIGWVNTLEWQVVAGTLALVVLVGVTEETLFRAMFTTLIARRWSSVVAVIVSSVLFAVAHAVNALGGQDLGATLVQVGFAFAFGAYAAAFLLVTGSVWPMIVFHAAFDAFQFLGARQTTTVVDAVTTAILLVGAAVLLAIHVRRGRSQGGAVESEAALATAAEPAAARA
ncbi:type II CAAX prenyl endopeptidase Rce1 family protein [Agromyces sp. MMS24-JH15]|uniref:CPBP family glutamic-type intramembrane protease n=1 Tax=Agromyces sp. MMS24-JH15 TaxID=3243765 RepID=UPI003748B746